MNSEEIKKKFSSLTEETSRAYEVELTKYSDTVMKSGAVNEIKAYLNGETDDRLAYTAFYCLNIIYRRSKNFVDLGTLFGSKGTKFHMYPTYNHLDILFKIERGNLDNYNYVLNIAYKDSINYPQNAGFVHLFADTVAFCLEENMIKDEAERKQWLDRGLVEVDKAIDLDKSYAKYNCTKGRLLAFDRRFDEAIASIKKAIELEDSTRHDYSLKSSGYQNHITKIEFKKQNVKMKEHYEPDCVKTQTSKG